jgi:hypothetical protein
MCYLKFMLPILLHFLHFNNDDQFSQAQLIFIIYWNTAICFGCTQAITRLYNKVTDSWYTMCLKLTYGKMKCELNLLQFHIHGPLKCLYLCLLRLWLKVAVYIFFFGGGGSYVWTETYRGKFLKMFLCVNVN